MKWVRSLMLVGGLSFVAACETQQAVQQGYISSHARSHLPLHQDMSKVVRGATDGCYYLMLDGSPQGYLSPFLDSHHASEKICDAVVTAE
jgi:hypothetical protein